MRLGYTERVREMRSIHHVTSRIMIVLSDVMWCGEVTSTFLTCRPRRAALLMEASPNGQLRVLVNITYSTSRLQHSPCTTSYRNRSPDVWLGPSALVYCTLAYKTYDQISTVTPWWKIRNFRSLTYLTVAVKVYYLSKRKNFTKKKLLLYFTNRVGSLLLQGKYPLSPNSANLYTSSWTFIKPYSCC